VGTLRPDGCRLRAVLRLQGFLATLTIAGRSKRSLIL
jgi:hypothetical protein